MSLTVGIVGLANVGKSTLFNALLKKQQALAANYPFATIEPNVGVVPVPDERLEKLARVIGGLPVSTSEEPPLGSVVTRAAEPSEENTLPLVVPATVIFEDIAGLVKGASKGEGLGNKFLAHIREVDLVCHLVRAFEDKEVVMTGSDPDGDYETVNTELGLRDLQTVEDQVNKLKSEKNSERGKFLARLKDFLSEGSLARDFPVEREEKEYLDELFLLTAKPEIKVLNVDEDGLAGEGVRICAKLEAELAGFSDEERREYLGQLGIKETGLDKLIRLAYEKLGLLSFLTAGEKEVRAWTVKEGSVAPVAAGVIHSDFEKNFIKAKVASFEDFVEHGGWKGVSEAGKLRLEGKEYVVQEGDVMEFMIGK